MLYAAFFFGLAGGMSLLGLLDLCRAIYTLRFVTQKMIVDALSYLLVLIVIVILMSHVI